MFKQHKKWTSIILAIVFAIQCFTFMNPAGTSVIAEENDTAVQAEASSAQEPTARQAEQPEMVQNEAATTATGIKFGQQEYKLDVGRQCSTTVSAVYVDCTESGIQEGLSYESSNNEVATIDNGGVLTATGTGTAEITAYYNKLEAKAVVNVGNSTTPPALSIVESNGRVNLSWTGVDKAQSYRIKRGTSPGRLFDIATNIATTYTDEAIDLEETYFYAVSAIVDGIESGNSNIEMRTGVPLPPSIDALRKTDMIKVNWTSPFDAVKFTLYRSTTPGGPYETLLNQVEENRYNDLSITADTTYYYAVKAYDSQGRESRLSEEIKVGPLTAVENKFDPAADDDEDGISNLEEMQKGTDIKEKEARDTGLRSEASIHNIYTQKAVKNTKVPKKINRQAKSRDNKIKVSVYGDDNLKNAVISVEKSPDKFLRSLLGAIGDAVEIDAGGIDINSAVISIAYDRKQLKGIMEKDLKIYWVDRDNRKLVPISNITVDTKNCIVSGTTTHFSSYILGGNMEVDLKNVEMVFAIDQSLGMQNIDPNNYRLNVAQVFISNIGNLNTAADIAAGDSGLLKIGLTEFSNYCKPVQPLTTDESTLGSKLTAMMHSIGSTNLADALWVSRYQFNESADGRRRIMVLVTDGKDTCGNMDAQIKKITANLPFREAGTADRNIIVDVVAVGNYVNEDLLKYIAESTNGEYFPLEMDSTSSVDEVNEKINTIYDKIRKQITFLNATLPPEGYDEKLAKIQFSEKYKGYDTDDARRMYTAAHTNLITGNFFEQFADINISSTGPDLNIARFYNSDDGCDTDTALGRGWRLNYDSSIDTVSIYGKVTASALNVRVGAGTNYNRITRLPWGTVVKYLDVGGTLPFVNGYYWQKIQLPDKREGYVANNYLVSITNGAQVTYGSGTKVVFEDKAGSEYKTPYGVTDKLVETTAGYELTRKDKSKYIYSKALDGKLSQITDRYGNTVTITYESGRIKEVTDPVGRKLTFTYNSLGKVSKITDPLGRYVEYFYDSDKNLVGFSDLAGKRTTYSYHLEYDADDATKLIHTRLDQIIDANGHQVIKNEYDSYGRLIKQYDGNDNVKYQVYRDVYVNDEGKPINEYEKMIRYFIDENGNESMIEYNPITQLPIKEMDAYGNTTTYRYKMDYSNNGTWTEFTNLVQFDSDGIITPEYAAFATAVDGGNKPLMKITTDKNSNATTSTYDAMNNLITVTDAKNGSIAYGYDDSNNLISKTDKKGKQTTYTYDTTKTKLLKETDSMGNETVYDYYTNETGILIQGLVKKITINRKDKNNTLISGFSTTQYKYADSYNNRTEIIDALGKSTLESHDAAGRLLQTTDANSKITKYTYDNMDRLTCVEDALGGKATYQYDAAGNKSSETNKNGYTTQYQYDNENQLVKVTDADGNSLEYAYDGVGNKVWEKNIYGGETEYDYDAKNRLIRVTDPLNHNTRYEYDVNTAGDENKPGFNNIKVTNPLGLVTLTSFDELGRKSSIKETFETGSRTTQYTYDANDNLIQVTDAMGKVTKYEYDDLNRQTRIIDGYGLGTAYQNETNFLYDVYANAQSVKYEKVTQTDALSRTTVKETDALGRLYKMTDAKQSSTIYAYDNVGNLTSVTDPKGHITSYEYDALNRKTKETDATRTNYTQYEYDAAGNNTAVTDRMGYRTQYKYDARNQLSEVVDPLGNSTKYAYDMQGKTKTVTDASGNATTYYYDFKGQLSYEKDACNYTKYYYYDIADNLIYESSKKNRYVGRHYVYDLLGRLKTERDAQDYETSYTYDLMDNVLTKEDGNGNITTYEYDPMYRQKKVTYPGDSSIASLVVESSYNVLGQMTRQENSLGAVDVYGYDELGRVTSATRQNQQGTSAITESTTYDEVGNKLTETNGNNVTTTNTYDALNRLGTSSVTVSGVLQTTTYGYDKNSNPTTVTDWRGNITTNEYDGLNRITAKKDQYGKTVEKLEYYPNGTQSKSYDALNNITQYAYDANNRLICTTDPAGHITVRTYDEDGNSATVTNNGKTTIYGYNELNQLSYVQNAKSETTSYTYDGNGNMLTQTDGRGYVTTYVYNAANKLQKRIDHGGAGNSAKTETYTYYADGSLHTKTDRNGNTTTYVYDIHGRLTSENAGSVSKAYTYDNNGNQLTVSDSTGTTARTYDGLDRVLTKTVPVIGTSIFQYDIITGVETGCIKETSTDPKGNVTDKTYDKAGRLWMVTANGGTTTYGYYDNGSRQSVVYQDGSREDYTYYADNLLWTLTNKKADGTVIDTYTYNYDASHNQTSKTDSKGTTVHTYDELNRLATVSEPNGRQTGYTYDASGNRLTETVTQSGTATSNICLYNEQNRLNSITTSVNGYISEVNTYTYDNNGNQLLTIKTPYAGGVPQTPVITATNTYDPFNQLAATVSNGTTVTNTYNGEGLRVAKSVNGTLTRYLYDYDKVVLETDVNGSQTARNVYGTNLLTRTASGETLNYMYNGHGDVTALMKADGTISGSYYYDAFGNILEHTGTASSITYAGYQYDSETGLYYLNSRMYDPKIARFLQEDTYAGDAGDPLSLNLYTYCSNEPVMYFDPTGHARGDFWDVRYLWENIGAVVNYAQSSPEEKQKSLELIEEYDDFSFETQTVKLFINPTKQLDKTNQAVKSYVVDDLGIKENSSGYKILKGVGKTVEAVGANGINLIKGSWQMGTTIGKPIGNYMALEINLGQLAVGNITGEEFTGWYDDWSPVARAENKELADMPGNMIKGVGQSAVGLVNNGYNFFNPNATLEQKTQAVGDFYNVMFAAETVKGFYKVGKPYIKQIPGALKSIGYRLLTEETGSTSLFGRGLGRTGGSELGGELSGPVKVKVRKGATPEQIQQAQQYVDGCNRALKEGYISDTGRVSTKGKLRQDASRAARQELKRAEQAGQPYSGHPGHVPDTTWTNNPVPYEWLDLEPTINTSIGGQANGYPLGYKPTEFVLEVER